MELYSIKKPTTGDYKDRGSKFFSFSHTISNQDEYKSLLTHYKSNYPEACHVCSAYRVYLNDRIDEYATDDGEPKGSSGPPILNQIKHFKIINVAVFVVRIFGGTRLGIPGLINAYGESAKDALEKVQKLNWYPTVLISINYDYEHTKLIEKLIYQFNVEIVDHQFKNDIFVKFKIEKGMEENLNTMLVEKSAGKLHIK